MPVSGYLKPAFLKFFCRRVYETKKLSVFTYVRHPRAYLHLATKISRSVNLDKAFFNAS